MWGWHGGGTIDQAVNISPETQWVNRVQQQVSKGMWIPTGIARFLGIHARRLGGLQDYARRVTVSLEARRLVSHDANLLNYARDARRAMYHARDAGGSEHHVDDASPCDLKRY